MKTTDIPIKNVEDYLSVVPQPARTTLETIRGYIKETAPAAEEVISYGIPCFKIKSPLISYGAAKKHCAFYVMSPAVMEAFKEDLKEYDTSPGTIRFPLDTPLPKALVRKLVEARIKENEAIQQERAAKKVAAKTK